MLTIATLVDSSEMKHVDARVCSVVVSNLKSTAYHVRTSAGMFSIGKIGPPNASELRDKLQKGGMYWLSYQGDMEYIPPLKGIEPIPDDGSVRSC